MISDWIDYISGWLPVGIWLVPMVGLAFSFIWWVVWKGTGFFSPRKFWTVLVLGWLLVITAYTITWSLNPPPPIPERILLCNGRTDSDGHIDWRAEFVLSTIGRRLAASPKAFVLLSDRSSDIFQGDFNPDSEIAKRISKRRIKYSVVVEQIPDDTSIVRIDILVFKGGKYLTVAELISPRVSVATMAIWGAQEVARRLGDIEQMDSWPGKPPVLSDEQCRKFIFYSELKGDITIDSSIVRLRELISANSFWTEPKVKLAGFLLQTAPGINKEEIYNLLIDVIRSDSKDSEALLLLGWYFLEFREWEEAESALKLVLNYNPDEPRVYYFLSRLMERRLDELKWKNKFALLKRALQLDPGYETARLSLAQNLRQRHRRPEAIDLLNAGLEMNPKSFELLLTRSAMELEMSRFSEAEATCLHLLALRPGNPKVLYNLGLSQLGLKHWDDAVKSFETSMENGGSNENLYYLGVTYQRKGDYEKAIYWFQRRFATMNSLSDRVAISARERIKMLKGWLDDSTRSSKVSINRIEEDISLQSIDNPE